MGINTVGGDSPENNNDEVKRTREVLMKNPLFKYYYEKLQGKKNEELEAIGRKGDDDIPIQEFEAAHFLVYERKMADGTWPKDDGNY